MFILAVTLAHRRRSVTCYSAPQAAGFIEATARQWGVAVSALDWSATYKREA